MENKQALMSAALLEAIWGSRKKDMIDLITPFILYAVAKNTSPGNAVDTKSVQYYVQQHFAYPDLPESIVKSALARNPLSSFKKRDKQIYLIKSIDDEIARMDQRERECNESIEQVGQKLSEYLEAHCKQTKSFSFEQTISYLHLFFSRYGLEIGTETLASAGIEPRKYEIDYYIARFIFECKDTGSYLYGVILELVKGYFLRLAIYIQPNNGNISSATFSNLCFVLDTPVLIDLLGYQGKERENNALSLYKMLKRQNATLVYLPNIMQEMIDILTAYKYSLIPGSSSDGTKTLEGLNARGYDTSDVEREIQLLESILEGKFGILQKPMPAYPTKPDGTVDEALVLGEDEIKAYIRDNTAHYSDENLESDVTSVVATHMLRNGVKSYNIESSVCIFVTNNADFVHAFNKYYKDNIESETFHLAITVNSLSAITWIKCGEVENLSETVLLRNAYCAMQPISEILHKLEEVLAKLKDSGQIRAEQVVALRASRVFQNDLWKESFGDTAAINEHSVLAAQKKYEQELIAEEKEEHKKYVESINQQHNTEIQNLESKFAEIKASHQREIHDVVNRHNIYIIQRDNKDRLNQQHQKERIRKKADQEAKKVCERWFEDRYKVVKTLSRLFIISGIGGLLATFVLHTSIFVSGLMCIYFLLSACSVYDTVISKKSRIAEWLRKRSYQYETAVREQKIAEYMSVLQNTEEKEEDYQTV